MQQENYLHIFSSYLADLFESKQFDLNDLGYIAFEFQPVCDKMQTRQDLINFLDKYIEDYPEFIPLKERLQDPEYKFQN